MLSSLTSSPSASTPTLFIFYDSALEDKVVRTVLRYSHEAYLGSSVVLKKYARGIDRYGSQLEHEVDLTVRKAKDYCVVIIISEFATHSLLKLSTDTRHLVLIRSNNELINKLPIYLQAFKLRWQDYIEQNLINCWNWGTLDRERLELWKDQFGKLGNRRWIGEMLLKQLIVWPASQTLQMLEIDEDLLSKFDFVCCTRAKVGKSGDALSNLLNKRVKSIDADYPDISDIRDRLDEIGTTDRQDVKILWIEDGLFSATEVRNYIRDLLGKPIAEGRRRKVDPLNDPSVLKRVKISAHFAIATDVGKLLLLDFLDKNDLLDSFDITNGYEYNLLTDEGNRAMASGVFLASGSNMPQNVETFLRPAVRIDEFTTENSSRDDILHFLRNTGADLFSNYLHKKQWQWPTARISSAGLGMFSLGLAFAFNHSVPKASLPHFWSSGEVMYEDRTVNWTPLFDNAM